MSQNLITNLWRQAKRLRAPAIASGLFEQPKVIAGPADDKQRDIIAIVADVEIIAAEPAADGKPAKPPTFTVKAYNGGALPLNYWDYPVVVDLAGMTFARNISANLHHDIEDIVGHVTDPTTDGKTLTLAGIVSGTGEGAQEFLGNAANGYPWQASIEASPLTKPDFIGEDASVEVNGRSIKGPVYVVRKSQLYGIAFLPRGADDRTSVKIAAGAAPKESNMDPKFKAWLIEMGVADPEKLTAEQLAHAERSYQGIEGKPPPQKPKPTEEATLEELLAEEKAKRDRVKDITRIAAQAMKDNPNGIETIEAVSRLAVEGDWGKDEFELKLLRATMPQAHTVFVSPNANDRNPALNEKVIEAACCMAGGYPEDKLNKSFGDQVLQTAHDRFPNGIGLKQLIMIAAELHGYKAYDVDVETQRAAFGYSQDRRGIRAGFSTLSLPGILSNTANKFLMEGWMSVDDAWRSIAARRPVKDFKAISTHSLTGGFEFEDVGPTGELKHGSVGETTYTNQAGTMGKLFSITRTDIINDDLDALTGVPKRLGRGGAIKLNKKFWTVFLNNSAFFTAGNNNVSTGGGSALGTAAGAALTAAELIFLNQTDPDGNPLALMPQILLVPPTLKQTAISYMNSGFYLGGTTALPAGNNWVGRFKIVTSPYMENANFTGYSAAAWYLLANPEDMAVIEVVFLNGKEFPVVETADAEFNVLGIQMRGYFDAGVALQEPRAGVRSAGS